MNNKSNLITEVINVFKESGRKPLNYKQVSKRLGIKSVSDKKKIDKILLTLKSQKKLTEVTPGKYRIKEDVITIIGRIDMTKSGSGYLVSDQVDDDIYIRERDMNHAFHDDLVEVEVFRSYSKSKKPDGRVKRVLERAKTEFVGIIELSKKFGFVIPDGNMNSDIFVPEKFLNGARDGDKVVVKITEWPDGKNDSPSGEIVDVLGKPGENETEIHSILTEYGLPRGFPQRLEEEAKKIPLEITQEEINKRKDYRSILTFTIDPVDAKDFDDALSFRVLDNGNYEVGVHIADVTHYVKPGTNIEQEAVERATSIYLVDRVIPMLPEVLSNVVCSLRPHEDKLCFAAIFELDSGANIKNRWFGRTVIHSDRRFTYEEAQEVIETGDGDHAKEVQKLNELAKKLREKRMSSGAIAFDREEVKFKLRADGSPEGVYFKVAKDSNKLIEEFMLLANRNVAEFIGKVSNKKDEKTFVYRVHDEPDTAKLAEFSAFLKKLGYRYNFNNTKNVSSQMNDLLVEVRGKGESNLIETLAVRTMQKAIYTTENRGHYGLSFQYYTHFTSPIRRYPDMMVHRLLQAYLNKENVEKKEYYEKLCQHSSKREKLAEEAERDSIKFKQAEFLQQKIGQLFEGTISGVTEWGIYVEINENKCEGMVRLRNIQGDFYFFDEANYRVVGRRNKKVFQLGDPVMVKIADVDVLKKQIDFELLSED
ncbi:MAG: ribonuclease R [Flavobacteriales bacterium]|nr:ribonuclease R [Flavobacteriales bacterium]